MGKTRRYNKFHVVRGVVVAADWDDDNRVVAVSIETDDDELFVDPYGKGEALLDYLDEYVEVRGVVHNDDGDYSLSVHGFRVIDDGDEEPGQRSRSLGDEDYDDYQDLGDFGD